MPAKFSRALRAGVVLLAATCALGPAASQAFTLINPPVVKLFINPKVGYTTSYVQVRGTLGFGSPPACPVGAAPPPTLTFKFYFDAPAIWSRNANCNTATGTWDTGYSPYLKPPVAPTVGTHVIYLKVFNAGTQVGTTAQNLYTIVRPPASPVQTQPSPSPSPPPSPSSTNASCPAAMLPPAGTGSWGDNMIAGLVVAAVLPIAGLTMFGPGTLLAFARRRRRLLMLLGISALTALTLSCTTVAQKPIPAPLISPPAASPSSCSA